VASTPLTDLADDELAARFQAGDRLALEALIARYRRFARAKSRGYFLVGGDADDIEQEALIGLYKAARDFRPEHQASFRAFAELCITRQIITAIKTATRYKHAPLNTYVSFSHTPAGQEADADCTLGDALPGPAVDDPATCVISSEELQSLLDCLGSSLSSLESQVLTGYLEGRSYEAIGEALDCDPKTVDNALQRDKRKVLAHLQARRALG
jgi:RNA polymerase sporulation-specific sigma factor